MCIILIGKIGKTNHELAKAQNPHGFSLFTKSLGLIKNPTEAQVERAVNEFGIWHYRIASSGKINRSNVHPFPVANGKALLYHNGVLGDGTKEMSDTACLAETLKNVSINTAKSVLEALHSGQRFVLANSKNPQEFYLYGDWKVQSGVLMSHALYSYARTAVPASSWYSRNLKNYRETSRGFIEEEGFNE